MEYSEEMPFSQFTEVMNSMEECGLPEGLHECQPHYADQARLGSHASPDPKLPGRHPVQIPTHLSLASIQSKGHRNEVIIHENYEPKRKR